MSCPALDELDGFAFEELGPVRAAQVALHASGCDDCDRELKWIRTEREAMAVRSRRRGQRCVSFSRVERALGPGPHRARRIPTAPWIFALAALFLLMIAWGAPDAPSVQISSVESSLSDSCGKASLLIEDANSPCPMSMPITQACISGCR